MSWHAIDSVDDALDATRSFLSPLDLRAWLKLALIAIFVGVGGGSGTGLLNLTSTFSSEPGTDTGTGPGSGPGAGMGEPAPGDAVPTESIPTDLGELLAMPELWIILAIAAGLLIVALVFGLLGETLRFVFYEALRTGSVSLIEPAKRRFGQALRLFGFKLGLQVLAVLPIAAVAIGAWAVGFDVGLSGGALIAAALVAALAGLVLVIAYMAVLRITNEFVVPTMVITDGGVLEGWRRVWPVIRGQLGQFGVYLVAHFLLLLAIGIGQSIVALLVYGIVIVIGAVVGLVVVFGVFGGLGAAAASTVGVAVLVLLAVLTLLVGFLLMLPVQVVVLTYVKSYEVSVLAAADEELRLLPADDTDPTQSDPVVG